MLKKTKWMRVLFILILLIILIGTYCWSCWQQFKHENGLDVQWRKISFNLQGISIKEFSLTQTLPFSHLSIKNDQMVLSWSTLRLNTLDINWQPSPPQSSSKHTENNIDLENFLDNLRWFPNTINVEKLSLSLPCSIGQCTIDGHLLLEKKKQDNQLISLQTILLHNNQQLSIHATLSQQQKQLRLEATSALNKQPFIQLSTQIAMKSLNQWQGQLNIFKLSNTQELLSWIQEWLPSGQALTEIPEAMELTAHWQLGYQKDITDIKPNQGYFNLEASFPNPWPIPQLGYIKGTIKTLIQFNNHFRIEQLDTDIALTNIDKKLLNKLPIDAKPDTVILKLKPLEITDVTPKADRALSIKLKIDGAVNALFMANAFIDTPQRHIELSDGLLQANTSKLNIENYHLLNARLSLPFTASINPQQTQFTLDSSALINLQQFNNPNISTKNVQIKLGNIHTELNYADKTLPLQYKLDGPLTITTSALTQQLLHPIGWNATGQFTLTNLQATFNGQLNNTAHLTTSLDASADFQKQLLINIKAPDIFLRGVNPFANTFKSWPETLEIATGKLNTHGSITIPFNNKPISATASVTYKGISGIYDRSEFLDLTGSTQIKLNNNTLQINAPSLIIKELNPGFTLGPLSFKGQYTAHLNALSQGKIDWETAELTLFSGKVWLNKGQLDLAKLPQSLNIQLSNIQIKDIFTAYPAEGLDGKGSLQGQLPIIISDKGITIKDGMLLAPQEGFLQFNSPQIQALGKSNPNMQIVTDALEKFNYTKLMTTVGYNQGKATLGLTIHGRNPDLKKGQPINLNINLEEDIPKLLTSLQLSDKVSEPIRKRVQERLQQNEHSSKN